jgi:hypothetical protein
MPQNEMTATRFTGTITGGDRDMISRRYKVAYKDLIRPMDQGGDPFLFAEVLVFVDLVRRGSTPEEAQAQAHTMSHEQLGAYFADEPVEPVDESAYAEAARDMAEWCLITGRSVDEYRSLDEIVRAAFLDRALALGIVTAKEA